MDACQLTDNDKEILKEVASIGMGHASTALAQLLKTKIDISLPEVDLIKLNEIKKYFPGQEVLLGLVLQMLGDIQGKILYLFRKDDAYKLIDIINAANGTSETEELNDELRVSTIKEVANILSGSYLSALSKFISMNLVPSIPHLAMDNAASIFHLASLTENGDVNLVLIRSKLSMSGTEFVVIGSLILELTEGQLKVLFDFIKKKYNP